MRPETGEWRRGNRPSPPVAWFERRPEERQLVRRKTVADQPMTIDEAAFEMTSSTTTSTCSTPRERPRRHRAPAWPTTRRSWRMPHPVNIERPVSATPVTFSAAAPAMLAVREAQEWLELTDEPMVFFGESLTGRGCVLYRRYDGHYGMITPAT